MRVCGASIIPGVQCHLMSLFCEELCSHQAEAIGRTGNEDARHDLPQTSWKTSSPRLEITVRTRSPAYTQPCLSMGFPRIPPLGEPVKMTSPGCNVMNNDA